MVTHLSHRMSQHHKVQAYLAHPWSHTSQKEHNITQGAGRSGPSMVTYLSSQREREIKFIGLFGTVAIRVHIVHISRVIITYTLE